MDSRYGEGVEPEVEPAPALSPEQRLLLAILARALDDLRSHDPDHINEALAFVHRLGNFIFCV
jgi:hypothetical protein